MPGRHPYPFRAAATLALAMLLAGAAGGREAAPGAQATAKVGIRLSVRPLVRIGQPGPAGPPCLWSNLGPGQYGLRAEWSDGRTVTLAIPEGGQPGCGGTPLRPVLLEALTPASSGDSPIILIVEAK